MRAPGGREGLSTIILQEIKPVPNPQPRTGLAVSRGAGEPRETASRLAAIERGFCYGSSMTDFAAIAEVLAPLDREVWVVTSRHGEAPAGLVATFVNQASIVPEMPRMLVGLAKQHHSCQAVEASGGFMLHLLTEDQCDLVWRFGLGSGRDVDKWAGLAYDDSGLGGPRLAG